MILPRARVCTIKSGLACRYKPTVLPLYPLSSSLKSRGHMALLARNHDPFRHLHSRIRREKVLNPDVILHYDSIQGDLAIWKWYVGLSINL